MYTILDKKNRSYVGSSVNVGLRKRQHLASLRKGIHPNIKLQRSFDKYGEEFFSFELLEKCEANELVQREQEFLDQNPYYNIALFAGSSMRGLKHSRETKKR